jgi:hypothetical protein
LGAPYLDPERQRFLERMLVQLRSRYSDWEFNPARDGFGITARKDRALVSLSLTTLHQATLRSGAAVPEDISRFVAAAGPRLSGAEDSPELGSGTLDHEALVWCVRAERAIRRYPRSDELVTRQLPGGLLAFVSEALPGEIMRGISRHDAAAAGLSEEELSARADHNTAARLGRWSDHLAKPPEHGRWLFTDDVLFSSSLLLVEPFLKEVAQRGGGEATLLVPDRGMLVAAVGDGASPDQLRRVSSRLYRLAISPLIPYLLVTDGKDIQLHPSERRERRIWPGWRQLLGVR